MHKLRSPLTGRGPGVHLARIAALSTALTALTALVVADVTAAESEDPTALALVDVASPDVEAPLIAARVMPDAVAPPAPTDAQLLAMAIDEPPAQLEKPKPKKKKRKLSYGRFEGY